MILRLLIHSALVLLGTVAAQARKPDPCIPNSPPMQSVEYHVSAPDPAAQTVRIRATLHGIGGDTVVFQFPVWAPGAYDIVNFGAYVSGFSAASGGRALPVLRGDTNTFRIVGAGSDVEIAYTVHDIEALPHAPWFGLSDIEQDLLFANGTALFGYPAGYKDVPYTVSYEVPKGWDIAVALDPEAPSPGSSGRHRFHARNYDELVDAPVQMGIFERAEFIAGGKPHVVTLKRLGMSANANINEVADLTGRIVGIIGDFFGEMPYDRYLFQYFLTTPHFMGGMSSFGALEHRNSSTYLMPHFGYDPYPAEQLAGVIAHEYWHLWSPKRIHVAELGPFDYQHPPRTNSLWFAEGLTEYYARMLLARNGMVDSSRFLREFTGDIRPLYGVPQHRSIAGLSMYIAEAPTSELRALYSKGPALALLLDAAIRSQSGYRRSLDDVMRGFNERYGRSGRTFADEDIIPVMEEITGAKLGDFFDRYIDGTDPLPFDELLPKIGLRVAGDTVVRPSYGAEYKRTSDGVVVTSVVPGGTFDSWGIRKGDTISQIDPGKGPLAIRILLDATGDEGLPVIEDAAMLVVRNGELHVFKGAIVNARTILRTLVPDPDASPEAAAARREMFGF